MNDASSAHNDPRHNGPSQRDPALTVSAPDAVTPPHLAAQLCETAIVPPPPPQQTVSFQAETPSQAAWVLPASFSGLKRFEILSELGRGGMGVVYQARQKGLNRIVALKMILSGSHAGDEELVRFRAEAEAVAKLQHPGIVQIFEIGEHEGRPYFALEFVDGGSLAKRLAGTPLAAPLAATLAEQLARAVQYAHAQGVVHRDLKPANVLCRIAHRPTPTRRVSEAPSIA